MDVFHLDRVHAGGILMALPLGFGIGGLSVGFMIDRLKLNRKKALLWGLGLCTLMWLVLIFLKEREHLMIVMPLFFFFGLIVGGSLPLSFAITRDFFPSLLMGTATGLMNTASFFGSAVYMPLTGLLLKSAVSNHDGSYGFDAYRKLLIVFFLSYVVAFVVIALLRNKKSHRHPDPGK
jgi:MFS family permease